MRALAITTQPSISTDARSPGSRDGPNVLRPVEPAFAIGVPLVQTVGGDEVTRHAFPSGLEIDGRRGRIDPSLGAAHALETRM